MKMGIQTDDSCCMNTYDVFFSHIFVLGLVKVLAANLLCECVHAQHVIAVLQFRLKRFSFRGFYIHIYIQ